MNSAYTTRSIKFLEIFRLCPQFCVNRLSNECVKVHFQIKPLIWYFRLRVQNHKNWPAVVVNIEDIITAAASASARAW